MVNVARYSRKSAPKRRFGCSTCKQRHLKCDETLPACQRCISSNLTCGGYSTPYIIVTTTAQQNLRSLRHSRPSQKQYSSQSDKNALDFFRLHVLNDVQDELFSTNLWLTRLLQVAATEPVLQSSIMALGAFGQYGLVADYQTTRWFALKEYNRAVSILSQQISSGEGVDIQTTLVTCILFTIIELRQNAWSKARHHLLGGLAIMENSSRMAKLSGSTLPSGSIMWPIIRAFRRLGNQMLLFFGGIGQRTTDVDFVSSKSAASAWKRARTLADANSSLTYIGAATRDLASSYGQLMTETENRDYHSAYHNLMMISAEWEQDIQEVSRHIESPTDRRTAKLLEIHYLCGNIKASMIHEKEAEGLWDKHYSKFIRICQLSLNVIAEERKQVSPFSGFFLDSGVLLPLYFVAHRCRDPQLRRLAIGLLEQCQHQEGALNGPLLAKAASSIMNEEEQGMAHIMGAGDIPEPRRLRTVFFNLQSDFQIWTEYDPDRFRLSDQTLRHDDTMMTVIRLPRAVRNAYCSLL